MTIVYDQRGALTTDDGGSDNNTSFRVYLPSTVLSAATGNQCQVQCFFSAGNGTDGLALSYIGQQGGANNWDFTGDQVKVTWNGGSSTLAATGGARITGSIVSTVLTVVSVAAGTVTVGQAVVSGGVYYGTILSNISGSGAGSTWNLSQSGSLVSATCTLPTSNVSDVVTLGENFSSSANYVFAFDITGTSVHLDYGAVTGVNTYYAATSGGNAAQTTVTSMSDSGTSGDCFFIGAIFITGAVTTPAWGWEIPPPQPPHPRTERTGAVQRSDDGTQAQLVNWLADGWAVPSFQPPHRAPEVKSAAIAPSSPGIDVRYLGFSPDGWAVPPVQPRHPHPERAAAIMVGDPGNQFTLTPPPPVTTPAWGWEVAPTPIVTTPRVWQRGIGITGHSQFASFQLLPWWEVGAPPNFLRAVVSRAAAIFRGDDGDEAIYVASIPMVHGWDAYSPQPPHPRPERAGAVLVGDQGSYFKLIVPFGEGWAIQPVQPPHPHPEQRAAAIMRGDDGTQARLVIPFHEGWAVQPWQPPATHQWRAGAVMVGDQGTYFPFTYVPPAFKLIYSYITSSYIR